MGRTGRLFASENYGAAPDICAIAKGLGAGYQPIGAMLCSADIHDIIATGSGFFQHGHTYLGHPVACAAALAVLERLLDDQVLARVQPQGDALHAALTDRFGQNPHVGDIRGAGLFRAIELVKSRETKEPFDPSDKIHARLKSAAFEAGLICYPMGGTVDGVSGDHVLMAPPFVINDTQIDELVDKLDTALQATLSAVSA